jgi:S1 RNA binding domain protein
VIQPGDVVKGTVVRLEEYGAFVEVPVEGSDPVTGLVHVSEVAPTFVDNIYALLTQGQEVEVKVLAVKDDGKVDLSMKQVDPEWSEAPPPPRKGGVDRDFDKRLRKFMHKSQTIQGERRRQQRGRLDG